MSTIRKGLKNSGIFPLKVSETTRPSSDSEAAELEKVPNVPSILKFASEMFLKSAVIFKSGTNFSV